MNIIQKPSKNFNSRGSWAPNMIVNHITAGLNVSSALNEFTVNVRASAHFMVDLDGTVYQCVDIRQAAWGNGTTTTPGDNPYFGDSKLATVRARKVNANLYTVSIEHVNAGGGILTAPQLAASIELHKYIIAEVKRIYGITIPIDRDHITGHCYIAPKTKPSCPGVYFPYDSILAGIKGNIEIKSDTTYNMVMKQGATYQVKLTSIIPPVVTIGTKGVLTQELAKQVGNDYYVKIKAVGKAKSGAGVFANGKKIFTVNIE